MGQNEHHIVPIQVYLKVFVALLVLTVVTVLAARVDFGIFNTVIALGIASAKAYLVGGYFMGLKYDDKLYTVGLLSAVFFLLLLFGFCYMDFNSRMVVTPFQ